MKLLPATIMGFVLSFATALLAGYCIAMAFPLGHGSPEFYAAEIAGVVIALTVFYLVIRKSYRRHRRRDPHFTERLA